MEDKQKTKTSIKNVLSNIFFSIQKMVSDIGNLARMEVHLAKQSLVNIFLLMFVLGSMLTATWLCVMGLVVVYLLSLHVSLLAAVASTVVLNFIVLLLIYLALVKSKRNLFFPATRRQLSQTKRLLKGTYREQIRTKD